MSKKLTPWFPVSVKPVRNGIYIASVGRNHFYRRWNGKWWSCGSYDLAEVQQNTAGMCSLRHGNQREIRWRGLAEQPKGARRG